MSRETSDIERAFARELRDRSPGDPEEALHRAYQLGRHSLERGLGVLDMGGALLRAIVSEMARRAEPEAPDLSTDVIEALFLEALSPFEMAYRGAREANLALRRIDEIREAESRRVAGELHDSAGQVFAEVHLGLGDLASRVPPVVVEELDRITAMLVRAEEQLRRIAHEFRPTMLDDLGLRPALAYLAEGVARRSGIEIRVVGATPERLPPKLETAVYRVAQEALTNVVRHASASHATIRLEGGRDRFVCSIADDGSGFDAASWSAGREAAGLGLRGIRERIAVFGGTLEVRSVPGRGTDLILSVPLEVPDAFSSADRR